MPTANMSLTCDEVIVGGVFPGHATLCWNFPLQWDRKCVNLKESQQKKCLKMYGQYNEYTIMDI